MAHFVDIGQYIVNIDAIASIPSLQQERQVQMTMLNGERIPLPAEAYHSLLAVLLRPRQPPPPASGVRK